MTITLNKEVLDNFKMKNHEYLVNSEYYDLPAGQQEYRLYSYLSTFFDNRFILDIGTFTGRSAVALSHSDNFVLTYDIQNHINDSLHRFYSKLNIISYVIPNVLDHYMFTEDTVRNVSLIIIDIDHLYKKEKEILNKLEKLGFSGIVILDDIHHPDQNMNNAMQKLWNEIKHEKYDITKYGHSSGTGLVLMNTDIKIELT